MVGGTLSRARAPYELSSHVSVLINVLALIILFNLLSQLSQLDCWLGGDNSVLQLTNNFNSRIRMSFLTQIFL